MLIEALGALQLVLAVRVFYRMFKTGDGEHVRISDEPSAGRVSIFVPVLNESARVAQCLEGLIAQPPEATEILVIDGGSTDATRTVVAGYQSRDQRVRWLDASPVDAAWTGKAWGLNCALAHASPSSQWVLCVDADVRVAHGLVRSLLAHAQRTGVPSFSVATRQRLSGPADALVHPAFLTTLIYRFGRPGAASRNRHRVQANGQCFFSRRDVLLSTGAFAAARASLCEDVTIARRLAECDKAVGFYEADALIEVQMYRDWRDTWANWPRSLPMRDQYFGAPEAVGLLEVLFVQALPLPLLIIATLLGAPPWTLALNSGLLAARCGVLVGAARAYPGRPWTYWLSPLLDMIAAVRLIGSAVSRNHKWRGRSYVRRPGGTYEPEVNRSTAGSAGSSS